ncbi:MAG TPA: class I SAM-dependent methyltransferase [Flavobacteriia bacterium]|nr:class I SAM-dependent methyltransferase [Flavobacteriia bacterium]
MIVTKSNKKKFIPALGYDWLTIFYDVAIKVTMPEKKFRKELVQRVAAEENEKVLEFGFGTAQNLIIAMHGSPKTKFIGLDIDPKVKQIAENKLKSENLEIPLVLYDGGTFPFESNIFDKVFSSLVFHQLDTEVKKHCLKEIHRILKPNGKLIIGDWGKPSSAYRRFLFYVVQLIDGFKTTQENVEGLLPVYISECGFKNVTETGHVDTKTGTYCYYRGEK